VLPDTTSASPVSICEAAQPLSRAEADRPPLTSNGGLTPLENAFQLAARLHAYANPQISVNRIFASAGSRAIACRPADGHDVDASCHDGVDGHVSRHTRMKCRSPVWRRGRHLCRRRVQAQQTQHLLTRRAPGRKCPEDAWLCHGPDIRRDHCETGRQASQHGARKSWCASSALNASSAIAQETMDIYAPSLIVSHGQDSRRTRRFAFKYVEPDASADLIREIDSKRAPRAVPASDQREHRNEAGS